MRHVTIYTNIIYVCTNIINNCSTMRQYSIICMCMHSNSKIKNKTHSHFDSHWLTSWNFHRFSNIALVNAVYNMLWPHVASVGLEHYEFCSALMEMCYVIYRLTLTFQWKILYKPSWNRVYHYKMLLAYHGQRKLVCVRDNDIGCFRQNIYII